MCVTYTDGKREKGDNINYASTFYQLLSRLQTYDYDDDDDDDDGFPG